MFKDEAKIGYSLALLDIAKEEKKLKEFYKESNLIIDALEQQDDFIRILDSYQIKASEKEEIIDKTFKGFNWAFINVMKMLASKNKFRFLNDILKYLVKQLQEILKIKQGIVYSTKPLSSIEIKKLEKKLSEQYKLEITLKNLIDNELIGGFRIEIGSIVIEDSIKSNLELIKESLKVKKGGV